MTESSPATRKQILPAAQKRFAGKGYAAKPGQGIANGIASSPPRTSRKPVKGIYGKVHFYLASHLVMPGPMAK